MGISRHDGGTAYYQPALDLGPGPCEGLVDDDDALAPSATDHTGATDTDGTATDTATARAALVRRDELPGPLAMHRLVEMGAIVRLDDRLAYRAPEGETRTGRARVVLELLRRPVPACGRTAAWVWLGGRFPDFIDVLGSRHFRSAIAGRHVHSWSRQVDDAHRGRVGELELTTPARTACDLALVDPDAPDAAAVRDLMDRLMAECGVRAEECLAILDTCSYLHTAPHARRVLGG
ncbi:MAG: hypothetical protein UHD09_00380, partial [Bifidobacterium sp.]|nr:hypothetical protein [Bifidobacterium sp.]